MTRWLFVFLLLGLSTPVWATTTIDGQDGVTIEGQTFSDALGNCLDITDSSNITVTNNTFIDCVGMGIEVTGTGSNITITNNSFENVKSGLYVNSLTGNGIVFSSNRCKNMNGPFARGQCVQFNGVSGTGMRVQNNYSIAFRGVNCTVPTPTTCTRTPEDHFNIYNSNGTSGDYIQITGNYCEGGGPSGSSACMVVGDNGGSYINVQNNTAICSGSVGFAVAGGSYIVMDSNNAYCGRTDVSNIAFYAYAITAACDHITFTNNQAWWYNKSGTVNTFYLPTSGGPECTNRTYTGNVNRTNHFVRRTADTRTQRQ